MSQFYYHKMSQVNQFYNTVITIMCYNLILTNKFIFRPILICIDLKIFFFVLHSNYACGIQILIQQYFRGHIF